MKFDNWKFSETLRRARFESGKSLREFAEEIDLSSSTLSRLENYKEPDLMSFYKCCEYLKCSMNEFFTPKT